MGTLIGLDELLKDRSVNELLLAALIVLFIVALFFISGILVGSKIEKSRHKLQIYENYQRNTNNEYSNQRRNQDRVH
jgi:hypothetical protein